MSLFRRLSRQLPNSSEGGAVRVTRRAAPRRRLLASLVVAGAWLASGCLSPTLPLPPPSRPELSSPNSDGQSLIRGRAQPHSRVFAENLSADAIAGRRTDETGRYEFLIKAKAGDVILFWYTTGTEQSQGLYLEVPSEDVPGLAGAPGQ